MSKRSAQPRNRILRSLRQEEYARLLPFSKRVTLATGDILFEAGDRIAEMLANGALLEAASDSKKERLVTTDPALAKKYGMEDESESIE